MPFDLQFKKGIDDAREVAKTISHSGNGWEILTFDFSNAIKAYVGKGDDGQTISANGKYDEIVILIDGDPIASGIYYIDDIDKL